MAMVTKKLSVFPALEGLNTSDVEGVASKAGMSDCDNVELHTKYGKMTRKGLVKYSVSGLGSLNDPRIARQFWKNTASGKTSQMVVCGDTKIFGESTSPYWFNDITGAATFDDSSDFYQFTYSSVQIICNSALNPYYWNGTGNIVALGGVVPATAAFGGIFKRYTLFSGSRAAPDRVYRSLYPDSPDSGYTNYFDLDGGDLDPSGNRAIFDEWNETCVIAKSNSLYATYSTGDYMYPIGYKPIESSHGCCGPKAWCAIPGDIAYASNAGIHLLSKTVSGASETTFLSYPISNLWTDQILKTNVEMAYNPNGNNLFVLCDDIDGTRNILGFNLNLGQWFMWKRTAAASIFSMYTTDEHTRVLGSIGETNKIVGYYHDDAYCTDYGTEFACEIKSGLIIPTRPDMLHSFNSITLCILPIIDGQNLYLTYWVDGDEIETVPVAIDATGRSFIGRCTIGTAVIGSGSGGWDRIHIPLQGTGTGLRFKLWTDGDTRSSFALLGYVLEYEVDEEDLSSSAIV